MSEEDTEGNSERVPEGMAKKTRKVKGKRRSKQKKTSSQSLLDQGKELLKAIQHQNDDDVGHINIQEQIRRLKDGDDVEDLDDTWGNKKKSSAWLWMSIVGIIIPLLGIAVGISLLKNGDDSNASDDIPKLLRIEDKKGSVSEGSHGWFHENSMTYLDDALNILSQINQAESESDITKLLRPSMAREKNPIKLSKWGNPVNTSSKTKFSWALDNVIPRGSSAHNQRGYITMNLKRISGEDFTAFFVHSDGKLLLDWDATMAWSEVSWRALKDTMPRSTKILRARLEKKASYDATQKGIDQSGYILSSDAGNEFIFAFVPLDSEKNNQMDKELKELLNYGSFTTALKKNLRVTVKVRYGDESGKGNRFEIVDYMHEGWVRP